MADPIDPVEIEKQIKRLEGRLKELENNKAFKTMEADIRAANEEIGLYQKNMGLLGQTMINTAQENYSILENIEGSKQKALDLEIKMSEMRIELLQQLREEKQLINANVEEQDKEISNLQDSIIKNEKTLDIIQKQTHAYSTMGKITDKNYELFNKLGSIVNLQRNSAVDTAKYYHEQYKALARTVQGSSFLEKRMEGAGKNTSKMLGALNTGVKHTKALGMMAANAAKSFFDIFSISNILGSVIQKIWSTSLGFMKEISAATSQFNAASGTAGKMAGDVTAAMDFGIGVSAAEVGEAASGLAGSFTEFTSVSKEARTSLVKTASGLARIGISSTTTGKNLQFLTKAMGQSEGEAENTLKGLASAASTLGKTPAALMEDLGSFSGDLAAYGSQWEDVLLGAAAAAKQSGLEMSKLMSLTEKFTTFDSAADAVGGLNALLGGDFINSLEMMEAAAEGPERVASMLSNAMKAGGKNFEMMSFWERKALADQIGMTTSELSMLMGIETKEGQKAKAEAQAKAKAQENYRKILSSTVDIARRLELFWKGLFGNAGLMRAMSDGIRAFMDELGKEGPLKNAIKQLGDLMGAAIRFGTKVLPDVIAAVVWLMKKVQSLVNYFGGDAKAGVMAFVLVLGSMKLASGVASLAMRKLVFGFTPLGKATKAATNAASEAAKGTKAIAEAKAKEMVANTSSIAPQQAATASTKTAGKAAKWSGKQMMSLGFAILMMGLGVAAAALGLAELVKAFDGMTNAGMALGAVGIVMGGFVLMLALMIPVIFMLGSVTYAVGAPLLALGLVFLMMGVGVLAAAFGMSLLVNSLKGADPVVLMSQAFAIGLISLAIAGLMLAGPAAFGLVMLTVAMVGFALAVLVAYWPLKLLAKILASVIEPAALFTSSLVALIDQVVSLPFFSITKGFGAIALGIDSVVDSIANIDENRFKLFQDLVGSEATLFNQINTQVPMAVDNINAFITAWERMAAAIDKMAKNPAPTIITTIMMERLFGSISSVSPKSAASTVRVIEKAKEYQKEVVKNKDNVDALVELLKVKGDVPGGGAGGAGSLDGAIIRLEVGGNRFGDYVIETQQKAARIRGTVGGEYVARKT